MADLDTFAGRFSTFEEPQPLEKRRVSTTKKKTPTTASWPHDRPTPEQLAKAGFYYRPFANSEDSVTCFLCQKGLDGWDADDNPALEHLAHVPDCGWAINICIEQRIEDMDRAEEDPMSEKMVEARRATFKDTWPHEGKRGWKCKIQKMVDAGWYYSPLPGADDCVACAYCGISLDGWEPKDDPSQEHRKRAPQCHFFSLVEESAKLGSKQRGKKGRSSRATRASKASRVSTQSTVTARDETEVGDSLMNDDPPMEDESILTTTSTTSKAGRGRKKANKPKAVATRTRITRGQEKSILESSVIEVVSNADTEDLRRVSSATITTIPEEPKPKRSRAKRSNKQNATVNESIVEDSQPTSEAPRKRGPKKKQATKAAQGADHELEEEGDMNHEAVANAAIAKDDKPKRGRKRKSDGEDRVDSSVMIIDDPAPPQEVKAKSNAKSKRAKPNPKPEQTDPAPDVDISQRPPPNEVEMPEAEAPASPIASKTATQKPKKGGKRTVQASTKASVAVREDEEELSEVPAAPPQEQESVPETAKPQRSSTTRPLTYPNLPLSNSPPASTTQAPYTASEAPNPPLPASPSSEQSSDAENQPPSLRQSKASHKSTPPAAQPPTSARSALQVLTPTASPSKRPHTIPGGLESDAPWAPANLDTTFLPWLTSTEGVDDSGGDDVAGEEDGHNNANEKRRMLGGLSSPEKKMSVEEWIVWNAERAEEELRRRCEGMIGGLEGAGMRAVRCVEGVGCVV